MVGNAPAQDVSLARREHRVALETAQEPVAVVGRERELLHHLPELIVHPLGVDQAAPRLTERAST